VSPTYDAVAETIGKGPGLARFKIGISASAQPELYGPITAITDLVAGVALRVRGALLVGERGGRHGCVVARLERDVIRTGAKAVFSEDELDRLHHRERHGSVEALQGEVRDDQEVGLPRSTVDGCVACSGRERLQAGDLRRRFDGSPTTRRYRGPDARPATPRRPPARSRARSSGRPPSARRCERPCRLRHSRPRALRPRRRARWPKDQQPPCVFARVAPVGYARPSRRADRPPTPTRRRPRSSPRPAWRAGSTVSLSTSRGRCASHLARCWPRSTRAPRPESPPAFQAGRSPGRGE
jgi:hypothetical protein